MSSSHNIVLIGYRGTGKSCIAQILSEILSLKSYSIDTLIVEKEGKNIPEIVQAKGWDYFRRVETELVQKYSKKNRIIVDSGGGVVLNPENIKALKKQGVVFWLKASHETIIRRIQNDLNRPALTQGKTFTQEVKEVLYQRTPLYKSACDFELDTEGKSVEEIADEIIEIINQFDNLEEIRNNAD